jgi:hypothetical protein
VEVTVANTTESGAKGASRCAGAGTGL